MQETWVQFLGQEDLLEKEMATHSCVLAWEIPWTEEPGGLQCIGSRNQTGLSDQTTTTTNPQYLRMWLYLDHIVLVKKKKKRLTCKEQPCVAVCICANWFGLIQQISKSPVYFNPFSWFLHLSDGWILRGYTGNLERMYEDQYTIKAFLAKANRIVLS